MEEQNIGKIARYNNMYMNVAYEVGKMSHCKRKQVGAILVRDGRILSMGWNGTPAGEDNCCEDENNKTKPEVIHAEENCLRKMMISTDTSVGSTMYVTLAPCLLCSTRLVDARIKKVFYGAYYPTSQPGIDYLQRHGVEVEQLTL